MQAFGYLSKMSVEYDNPVLYYFCTDDQKTLLNPHLGKKISLKFSGKISCVACGRAIKKSYQQGYCFPCTQKLAQCDLCVIKPDLCHYHKNTCREPNWGVTHCMTEHYVYLSDTSSLKVGLTRKTQIPGRWIDQGATQAITLFELKTRRIAGFVEVELSKNITDKTNWRNMLKGKVIELNISQERDNILNTYQERFKNIIQKFGSDAVLPQGNSKIIQINYPILKYPLKINALSFDKSPEISGELQGIKGQYLILDIGVINIRKFGGYQVGLYLS